MPQGLKITFLVHAIVALVFGVVMYLIPAMWATFVNWVPFDPGMTRGYRAAMLALAISSWLGYRAVRWEQVRTVVQMEIGFTVLGTLGALYEALFAGGPSFLWIGKDIFLCIVQTSIRIGSPKR